MNEIRCSHMSGYKMADAKFNIISQIQETDRLFCCFSFLYLNRHQTHKLDQNSVVDK